MNQIIGCGELFGFEVLWGVRRGVHKPKPEEIGMTVK